MAIVTSDTGQDLHGLDPRGRVLRNPTTAQLYTAALLQGTGRLSRGGALVVDTGRFTGRSPKDKFVVDEPGSRDRIWWGDVNKPLSETHFEGLRAKVAAHLEAQETLYVIDHFAGAEPAHRVGVRVVTASPYHALFAKTMFIVPKPAQLDAFTVDALVLHAPEVEAVPEEDGTRTGTFVVLHPSRSEVLIGGTFYAGEIKKSIFTLMNDRLPLEGVLPMHCSANVGEDGHVAVFFGLSGTGKTTLSADADRALIGDDEHGWGPSGVFNIEGGCYAKVIRLSAEAEPQIWRTTRTFGTILENVAIDETGAIDLDDDSKTENTRAAYKLERIANALPTKHAGHPSSVVFLTADAFGILPPIARLSREQAMYWFLTGFTAKLAGHRDRRHRAAADVLDLLRRPVPATAARGVRAHARGEARPAPRDGVARQHGVDTAARTARGTACRSPSPAGCSAPRCRARSIAPSTAATRCSASRCPSPSPAWTRRCSIRARRGPTPTPTTRRRASWQRASAPASRRNTRTTPAPRSRPAARFPPERRSGASQPSRPPADLPWIDLGRWSDNGPGAR